MIVGIVGHKRAGKDTAAQGLVNIGWRRVALADPIRRLCSDIFMWSDEWIDNHKEDVDPRWNISYRRAAQLIGTELFRNTLPTLIDCFTTSIWIDHLVEIYRRDGGDIVVPDVRFLDEGRAIRDLNGVLIRIDRPGAHGDGHASETDVDAIRVDHVLLNDGTPDDLQSAVVRLVERRQRWV